MAQACKFVVKTDPAAQRFRGRARCKGEPTLLAQVRDFQVGVVVQAQCGTAGDGVYLVGVPHLKIDPHAVELGTPPD